MKMTAGDAIRMFGYFLESRYAKSPSVKLSYPTLQADVIEHVFKCSRFAWYHSGNYEVSKFLHETDNFARPLQYEEIPLAQVKDISERCKAYQGE